MDNIYKVGFSLSMVSSTTLTRLPLPLCLIDSSWLVAEALMRLRSRAPGSKVVPTYHHSRYAVNPELAKLMFRLKSIYSICGASRNYLSDVGHDSYTATTVHRRRGASRTERW